MKAKKENYKQAVVLFVLTLLISVSFLPIIGSGQGERSTDLELIIQNINDETISITASLPSFEFSTTHNENQKYTLITLEEEAFTLIEGKAKLPAIRRLVEIPQGSNPEIIINDIVWEETSLQVLNMPEMVFPLQPSVHKTGEVEEFVFDEEFYNSNQYYPGFNSDINEIINLRGRQFAIVEITPVQYNPSTGDLKLMVSCDITMKCTDGNMDKTIENIERYSTQGYEQLISNLCANYGYYEQFAEENRDPEGFLFIVDDAYSEEIAPLTSWKTSMGYDVTVTLTSEIPGGITSSNLQDYIQDAYDTWTPPPAYILLVGDTPQIPAMTGPESGGETDTYYVTTDGDDVIADIHIGRFPAGTEEQVTIMVDKTVYYEQGVFPDIEWIKKAAFIASSDHGQLAEETHDYCIDTWMTPNDYVCDQIYQASGGSGQDITDALNDGRSICIYSGHGYSDGWACVPFDSSAVYALENEGIYPFVASHACVTSQYEGTSEVYSEAWLRAEGKGGIAFWGSSVNTYWDEDDVIQRRYFDAWFNNSMERIGQFTDYGMYLSYVQNPGLQIAKFIESYNVMGDASVKIWTDDPFVPDHDITVLDITVPDVVAHGEEQTVSALVKNSGNNTETGIVVDFLIDDVAIDTTTIASLAKMESTIVSFPWNPAIGTYVVAIESQPIPDEYDLLNNNANKTVQVIAAPAIEISPTAFTFLVPTDSSDTDTLTITNLPSAEAALDYSISYAGDLSGSWISASPETGTVAIDDADLVTITVDTTGLDEGNYQGTIIVQSNDLDDPELTATVDLTVVYGNDMAAISVNSPTGAIPDGSYTIDATVQNLGYYPQTDVLVNCSIFEGGIGGDIYFNDFSENPTDWTITNIVGTAWSWDSSDERMENTYSGSPSGYLDSPVMDCSGKSGISLEFWHYWKADYSSGNQDGYVYGSTDGGATWPHLIDSFHHNDPAEETAVKTYDISSWADNQAQVMVRFDITNDNDWYWYIDDFNVTAEIAGDLVYYSEALVDLAAYASTDIMFTPDWDAYMGIYGIQVTTLLSGDEQASNDVTAEVVSVEGPSLAFDPSGYDFGTIVVDTTDSTAFDIWNGGVGTLTYSLSESCSWVDVSPLSGDSTGEHDTITVDIDTTGLTPGSYQCDISITSDGGNDVFTVEAYVVSDVTPLLDIEQNVFDRGFPIRHAADGDWAAAQSFLPTMSFIPQVDLYMRSFGVPEFDLVVELRQDGPEGTILDTVVFTPGEVPSDWTWLVVDFTDTPVTPSTDYFIVCPPAPSGVTTSFGYEWGYAFGDQYGDGAFWFTRDGGALWRDLPSSYEFTFKTYGLI